MSLFRNIKLGEFEYTEPYWDDASEEVKDLINSMLIVEPSKRLNADEAMEHQWLSDDFHKAVHMTHSIDNLKKYNARRRLKGAVRALMAARRLDARAKNPTARKLSLLPLPLRPSSRRGFPVGFKSMRTRFVSYHLVRLLLIR